MQITGVIASVCDMRFSDDKRVVFGESYFRHVVTKGTRPTVKPPVVGQTFVANMSIVGGDGFGK